MSRASEPLEFGKEAGVACVSVATFGCAVSEDVEELEDDEVVSGPASGSDLDPLPSAGGAELSSGSKCLKSKAILGSCCCGGG